MEYIKIIQSLIWPKQFYRIMGNKTFLILILIFMNLLSVKCKKDSILKLEPSILRHPLSILVNEQEMATFSVNAIGVSILSYQWYKNGEILPGATDSVYTTPPTVLADHGASYIVTISNQYGHVVSSTAILTIGQALTTTIKFTTEGSSFSPLIVVDAGATILWTWADQTTSNLSNPKKNFGSAGKRVNTLVVHPWSALKTINIGYDGSEGGSNRIPFVANQNVSMIEGMHNAAPYLEIWCSSFNPLQSLDFSNFINLHTIECYDLETLQNIKLDNTPNLKRACFEDSNLLTLDLSQSPALEDLRAAQNIFSSINFGTIGSNVWHICVRDNIQLTDVEIFADLTQFPEIAELYIWNTNQTGSLNIPSTSSIRNASIQANDNEYTSLNLSGALQNPQLEAKISIRNNHIRSVDISGCVQICSLNLENNDLSSAAGDQILTILDNLGRNSESTPPSWDLNVNLKGNDVPSSIGYAYAENLAAKGWTIETDAWTLEPGVPAETGESSIDFITNGDITNMRCDFYGSPSAIWHWSDGTTSIAVSGVDVSKSGLGSGIHSHYLAIDNGAGLIRFGASFGGGNGNLVSISNFRNSPSLRTLYVYSEPFFTELGSSGLTKTNEYHLKQTALSATEMDHIFADAVETNVINGTLFCNNFGTSASNYDRRILESRGWDLQ